MRIAPLIFAVSLLPVGRGQSPPLTLGDAVKGALEKYPSIRVVQEQAAAAAAGINLARTAYLPRVDFLAQINRATRNNVYGMLLPQSTISPISGPPFPNNSFTNVWGSATGLLFTWEPFDFGFRRAWVDLAESSRRRAETAVARSRLEVATVAADVFFTILAAEQTVRAAQAGVDRAKVLDESVRALVRAELRPGADAARTRAELALAERQLIQAEQAVAVSRAAMAQMLGVLPAEIAVAGASWLEPPKEADPASAPIASHPAVAEQSAAIDEAKARQRTLDRSWFPKFSLQAASSARGTGARPDFTTGGAAAGLGPNIHNWGVGFTMTFPVFDFASLRARNQVEVHRERAEAARLEQVRRDLEGRIEQARAVLAGSRRIAHTTPVQLESARIAEQQANVRYKAGLGTILEVAEAQRLLAQAEIDDSLARLNVWRAMVGVAAAQGSIDEFLR
jgi:outer membrane protein